MRRANRVPVAPLAEDVVTGVLVHGVIASEEDPTGRHEVMEDPTGQALRQSPGRPAAFAEDPVVAGGVAGGQGTEGPQEVADGAAADGQDRGQGQRHEAKEGGPSEGASQGAEEGAGRLGYSAVGAL